MRTCTSILAILMAILSQLAHLSLANWTRGKGAQINFYTDTQCTAYHGEVAAWWNRVPLVAVEPAQLGCITLDMPGDSLSINTAAMWAYSAGMQPAEAAGYCVFYDGFECNGQSITVLSFYHLNGPGCQPSRSFGGYLWKSAKCYII
ncbi:hypothetical protein B0H14DRAFT_2810591 [Mycena olivaceomarginata]|nr:hypothetical protein B0H14DRAFT_2810591 [Mycena olivaceomarginata]